MGPGLPLGQFSAQHLKGVNDTCVRRPRTVIMTAARFLLAHPTPSPVGYIVSQAGTPECPGTFLAPSEAESAGLAT